MTCEVLISDRLGADNGSSGIAWVEVAGQVEDLALKVLGPDAHGLRGVGRIGWQVGPANEVVGEVAIGQPAARGEDGGFWRVRLELLGDGADADLEVVEFFEIAGELLKLLTLREQMAAEQSLEVRTVSRQVLSLDRHGSDPVAKGRSPRPGMHTGRAGYRGTGARRRAVCSERSMTI